MGCHGPTCELQNHLAFEALNADTAHGDILIEGRSYVGGKHLYASEIPHTEYEQTVTSQQEGLVNVPTAVID